MPNFAPGGHRHPYSVEPVRPRNQAPHGRALPEGPSDVANQYSSPSDVQHPLKQPSGEAAGNVALTLAHTTWTNMQHDPLSQFHNAGLNFTFSVPTPHAWPGPQPDLFTSTQTRLLPQGNPFVTDSLCLANANQCHRVNPAHFGAAVYGIPNVVGQDLSSSLLLGGELCPTPCIPLDHPYSTFNSQPSRTLDFYPEVQVQAPVIAEDSTPPVAFPQAHLSSQQDQGGDTVVIQATGSGQRTEPTTSTSKDEAESSVRALEAEPAMVCFGMFIGVTGTAKSSDLDETSRCPVKLASPEFFIGTRDPKLEGDVGPESLFLTSALLDEPNLELQATCTVTIDAPKLLSNGKRLRVSGAVQKCSIDIILYGPPALAEALSDFIEECNEHLQDDRKLYLQDPVGCDRNLPYCNPQRLPPLDPAFVTLTSELAQRCRNPIDLEDIEPRPELLDLLDSQEDLPETAQPPAIATPLERHQKQALTFMLRREQGWAFDGTRADIWEAVDGGQGHLFVNRISDSRQADEPPPFYGGIIADPMGLGKTLTMISLIASDFHNPTLGDTAALVGVLGEESCGLTLIIVPPALLGTWENEFTSHVLPGSLPWRLHHGKSRLRDRSELEDTALVLTTYHTVSMEGRSTSSRESSMLFTTRWRRVVLDEAHLIRNRDSQMARAVCALNSVSRWAVTGTPIQNHISDLAALLKFLNIYPYSEKRVFDADISHLWKSGNPDEAVKRLKRLAGCLLLRRPKGVIQLPPRHDQARYVEFDARERQLYDQVRTQVIARIDESLSYGARAVSSFVSILQQIEAMRIMPQAEDWQTMAQSGFNLRFDMGSIQCHSCSFALDATSHSLGDAESVRPLFGRCLRFICSNCVQKKGQNVSVNNCGHVPPYPMASVSTSPSSLEESPVAISLGNIRESGYCPTKVKALIEDLQGLPGNVKCVVFSTWRMTLDVVEAGLARAGIGAIRFDGKVPQRERQGVIDQFRNDPSLRAMLLTLSCGAVGLTLTVASRAYLMEPHWNPTIEDQALARIHRIGQKQNVTTLRFYVRDSFEENVVKNQQSKRDLASILLAPSGTAVSDIGHLERLRALI